MVRVRLGPHCSPLKAAVDDAVIGTGDRLGRATTGEKRLLGGWIRRPDSVAVDVARRPPPEPPRRREVDAQQNRPRPVPHTRSPSAGAWSGQLRLDPGSVRASLLRSRPRCSRRPEAAGRTCVRARVLFERQEEDRLLSDSRCSATRVMSRRAPRAGHSASRPHPRSTSRSGSRRRSCSCDTRSTFRRGTSSLLARGRTVSARAAG